MLMMLVSLMRHLLEPQLTIYASQNVPAFLLICSNIPWRFVSGCCKVTVERFLDIYTILAEGYMLHGSLNVLLMSS